jgi:hypothetical protein
MRSQLSPTGRRGFAIAALALFPLVAIAENVLVSPPPGGQNSSADIWMDPAKLRASIDEKISLLSSVVLHETVARYTQARKTVRHIDTLDTDVEIIDGAERYSGFRRNSVALADSGKITGAWSFGEVVTLLRGARDALDQSVLDTRSIVIENGTPVIRLAFRYPSDSHRWFVSVDSRIYWLDFEGDLRISPATGDILRISWQSTASPPAVTGVASVLWTVDFRSAEIGGRICTLPDNGTYRVNHSVGDAWSEWNVTKFSEIGRYGSQVSVTFDP